MTGVARTRKAPVSPRNLWHGLHPRLGHAQALDWVPGRATPTLGVGDRREGGAVAQAGEKRRQLARRGAPGSATSHAP